MVFFRAFHRSWAGWPPNPLEETKPQMVPSWIYNLHIGNARGWRLSFRATSTNPAFLIHHQVGEWQNGVFCVEFLFESEKILHILCEGNVIQADIVETNNYIKCDDFDIMTRQPTPMSGTPMRKSLNKGLLTITVPLLRPWWYCAFVFHLLHLDPFQNPGKIKTPPLHLKISEQ